MSNPSYCVIQENFVNKLVPLEPALSVSNNDPRVLCPHILLELALLCAFSDLRFNVWTFLLYCNFASCFLRILQNKISYSDRYHDESFIFLAPCILKTQCVLSLC